MDCIKSWILRATFLKMLKKILLIDIFFFLETIDKENDAIRHAIRQKTEERDEYVANRAKRTRITRN